MPSYSSSSEVFHRKFFLSFSSLSPFSILSSSSSSFLPSSLYHGFLRLSSSSQKTPHLPLFSFCPYLLQKKSFSFRHLSVSPFTQRRLASRVRQLNVKEEEEERKLGTRQISISLSAQDEDLYGRKERRRKAEGGKVREEKRLIRTRKQENSKKHSSSCSSSSSALLSRSLSSSSFFSLGFPSPPSPSLLSQLSSSLSFFPSLRFSSHSSSSSSFFLSHPRSFHLATCSLSSFLSSSSPLSSCFSSLLSSPLLPTGLSLTRERRDVDVRCLHEKEREERRRGRERGRGRKERSTFSSSLVPPSCLSSRGALAGCFFLFLSDKKDERAKKEETSEEEKKKIKSSDIEKEVCFFTPQRQDWRVREQRNEEGDDREGSCRERRRLRGRELSSFRETLCRVVDSFHRGEGDKREEKKRRREVRGGARRREMFLARSCTSSYRQGKVCLDRVEKKRKGEERRRKRLVGKAEGERPVDKEKERSSERGRDKGDLHARLVRERRISKKAALERRKRLALGKNKISILSHYPISFPPIVDPSHHSPSSSSLSLHRGVHTPGKKVAQCQEETSVSSPSSSPLSFLSFSLSPQEHHERKASIQRSFPLPTGSKNTTEEEDFSDSFENEKKRKAFSLSSFLSKKSSFPSESLAHEEKVNTPRSQEKKAREAEAYAKTTKEKDEKKERDERGYGDEEEVGGNTKKSALVSRLKWDLLVTYKIFELVFLSCLLAIGAGGLLACLYILPYIRRWRDQLGGWVDYLSFFTIPKGKEEEEQVKSKVENALFHLIGFAARVAGPTYLKCLQWVGTRRDLFPQHLCDFCARYQRQPADSSFVYPHVSLLMERRLGKNWREELILDPRPIGSGCIAVVYRGLLRLHVNEERDASHRSFLSQAYYPYESPYKEEEQLSPPPISRPVSSSERSSLSEGTLSSTFSTLSAPGESDVSSSSSSFFASPPPTLIETRAEVKKKKEEEHEGDRVRSVGNEKKKKKERGEEEREDDDVWMCVAVKVVKPMTRQSMEVDLHLLCSLARFIDSLPGFQWISLTPGAEEFASTMRSQLDLKKEALHLIQFRENFGLPNPVFPLSLTRLDPISHSSTAHVKKHLRLSRDRSNFSLLSSSPSSPSTNLTSSTSSSLSPVLPSSSSDLPPSSPSDPSSSTPPSPDLSSSSFSSFSSFLSLPLLKEVISSYLPFSFFSSWGASGLPSSSSPRLLKKRSSSSSSLVVFPYPVLPLCDEEFLLMTLEQGIPLDLLLQHSAREREEERRRTRERDEEKEKRRRRRKGRGWVMRCVLGKKEEEKKDEKRENDTNAHAGEEREREEEEDGRSKRGLLKKESRERKEFVTREDEEKNVYESELVNAAQMACEQMKAEREGIGRVALHTFLKMLLLDNFLHADLHPGNILVRRGISLLPPSSSLSSSSSPSSSFFSSEKVVWKDEQRGMDVLTNEEEEGREKQNKSSFSSSSSGSSQAMGLPSFTSNAPVIPLARFSLSSSSSDEIDLSPVSSKEDLHSFSASSSSLSREMKKEKRKRERGRRYRYEPYLQLIFLDCGLVAALYGDDRENFLLLLQAIALNKGIEAGRLLVERARKKLQGSDARAFERGVATLVKKYHTQEEDGGAGSSFRFASLNVGELLAKVLDLSRRYQVILDSQFANIFLAMSILDGVGKQLDPHADVMKTALPYALTAVKNLFYSSSTSSSSSSTSSSSSFSSSSPPAATSTSTISPTPTSSVAAAAGGGGGKKLTTEGSEE